MKRNLKEKAIIYSKLTRRLLRTWLRWIDPSVVRFKNPRRFPRWVMGVGAIGIVLVVGAAAVAAAIPEDEAESRLEQRTEAGLESTVAQLEQELPIRVVPEPVELNESRPVKQEKIESKESQFYDPVYVFFDGEVERVTAYPLASPPGVVVDLKGTPEPALEAEEFVGKDPRIRSVKRRVTASGIRYIIGLTTPIKRVNIFNEGNVAMVFPVS